MPKSRSTKPQQASSPADGSCFRQIEFAGILKGTENRDLAEQWIDFMLGKTFQEDIPLKMFVFPANEQRGAARCLCTVCRDTRQPGDGRPGSHRSQPRNVDQGLD